MGYMGILLELNHMRLEASGAALKLVWSGYLDGQRDGASRLILDIAGASTWLVGDPSRIIYLAPPCPPSAGLKG